MSDDRTGKATASELDVAKMVGKFESYEQQQARLLKVCNQIDNAQREFQIDTVKSYTQLTSSLASLSETVTEFVNASKEDKRVQTKAISYLTEGFVKMEQGFSKVEKLEDLIANKDHSVTSMEKELTGLKNTVELKDRDIIDHINEISNTRGREFAEMSNSFQAFKEDAEGRFEEYDKVVKMASKFKLGWILVTGSVGTLITVLGGLAYLASIFNVVAK